MPSSSAVRQRPHRLIVLAVAVVIASLILLVVTRSAGLATSGGDPYAVPLVVDTNPAPNIVETTLTAAETDVDIGNGVTAHAQTFNGTIPGPTFELNVGDRVIVHYENHLTRESGIHWHGIELANEMDGTPFTQNMVPAGGSFLYEFTVTRPGMFWYHPHHHSSTDQVFKGLYGAILVKDPNEDALQASGTLPSDAQTFPIVLSDTTVCKTPGSNDLHTYDDNTVAPAGAQPWAGGGGAVNTLPAQLAPVPKNLCEGPAVASMGGGSDPYPVDEDGVVRGPFAAGDIPNIQTANGNGRVNEGQTVLTNGKNVGGRAGGPLADQPGGVGALAPGASTLDVQPGQGLRLEILNASTTRYMRLLLTDPTGAMVPLFRVGGEGGLINNAVEDGGTQGSWPTGFDLGEILVPPGTRSDFVAAIPPAPTSGVLTLWTRDYSRTGSGTGFVNIPTVPVMHLNLAGSTVTPAYTIASGTALRAATGDLVPTLGPATGSLLNPATFTPTKKGLAAQNIVLNQAAGTLAVDGTFGTHDVPAGVDYSDAAHLDSSRYAKEGDILRLTAENGTGAHHPFHLHGFSIQPLKLDGPPFDPAVGGNDFPWPYPEFRDNIDIPNGYRLNFAVKLDPRPMPDGTTPGGALGRWLFHCHIFFHATNGMLSELVVTSAANGNERPDINANLPSVTVDQGKTATMTGTYKDRDGDPVTLSASVGTVTDTGGGNWSWTYTAGTEETSKFVYITATDAPGNKGQAPFQLNVNPTAPTIGGLVVDPKKFKPSKDSMKKPPKGSKIRFDLSKASTVDFTVSKLKPKKPKVSQKAFSRTLTSGAQAVTLTGRFNGKALPKGKYQLTAQATDAEGRASSQATTTFKIVAKKKHKHHHHHHHK
jgi:FtsP/CotA-like multicopper oxidase with cupredoxin domain